MGRYLGRDDGSVPPRNRPMHPAGYNRTPVTSRGRGDRRSGHSHDLLGYLIGFSIVAAILWFIFVEASP